MSKTIDTRIVCAAIRHKEEPNLIIAGVRHYDSIMRSQVERSGGSKYWLGCEQGFLDNKGNFLTREQAHIIALQTQQIIYRCGGDKECLFSENLY
jgi:hypothetical protein